jgi:hypothetical protein
MILAMTLKGAQPRVALFALVFVGYAYFYQAGGWNQNSRFDLTRAMIEHGTLSIDRYAENTGDVSERDGHLYCDKAPGVSFLAVPAWLAVYAGSARPPRAEHLAAGAWLATVTAIGVPSALAVIALMQLAMALGLSAQRAAVIAAGWGMATLAFPYSTLLYGHQLSATMLITAFAILVGRAASVADDSGAGWRLIAVGFLLGASVAADYTSALAAVPIAIYAVRIAGWRRAIVALIAGAAVPGVALAVYHTIAFGGPLTLSYKYSIGQNRHLGWFMGLGTPDPHILAQITFSSYRGLFYSAPWLLLAIPGGVGLWRRGHRAEVGVCVSIIVLFLWLNASLVDWQGGWAMGPRYLIPAIPFLVALSSGVLVPPAPGSWWARATEDPRIRHVAAGAFAAALALSLALMLIGVAVKPEVDTRVPRPFEDFLWPHFLRGEIGVSTQGIDMLRNPRGAPRQAWNLGYAIGLSGRASLVPLFVAWAACAAWLAMALQRADRHAMGRS